MIAPQTPCEETLSIRISYEHPSPLALAKHQPDNNVDDLDLDEELMFGDGSSNSSSTNNFHNSNNGNTSNFTNLILVLDPVLIIAAAIMTAIECLKLVLSHLLTIMMKMLRSTRRRFYPTWIWSWTPGSWWISSSAAFSQRWPTLYSVVASIRNSWGASCRCVPWAASWDCWLQPSPPSA